MTLGEISLLKHGSERIFLWEVILIRAAQHFREVCGHKFILIKAD